MTSDPQPQRPAAPAPLAEALPDDTGVRKHPVQRPLSPQALRVALAPEAESRMRLANLSRLRGDIGGAVRELRAALEIEPASAQLHEMLADLQAQIGETTAAIDGYRRAQSIGAGPAVEAKIGRLLIGRAIDVDAMANGTLVRGGGYVPLVASLLIPGLGLALAGQMNEAAISFCGWLVTLAILLLTPAASAVIERPFIGTAGDASPGGVILAVIVGAANLGFYVYSLMETMRVAKPAGKDE